MRILYFTLLVSVHTNNIVITEKKLTTSVKSLVYCHYCDFSILSLRVLLNTAKMQEKIHRFKTNSNIGTFIETSFTK